MFKIRVSVAIPHVSSDPYRVSCLEELLASLRQENTEIEEIHILDDPDRCGIWPTVKRAWQSALLHCCQATHHLILADDMRVCRDFVAGVKHAIAIKPQECLCLFSMRPSVVVQVQARQEHWYTCANNVYGSAVLLPVTMIEPFLRWCEQHIPEDFKYDDSRLSLYLMQQKQRIWTTVPSLVWHAGNGHSLLGTHIERQAIDWLGDTSALSIDWAKGANKPYHASGMINYAKRVYRA